ncbi:MAG TPA: GGDEF domain-containing protein [Steroidobacteraceae bacterium]|nr:GGDEF domain-containing protein [Steroidobacteraceae bacterium]
MKAFWHRPDPALAVAGIEGERLVARVRLIVLSLLLITPTYKLIRYPEVAIFVWGFVVVLVGALMALSIWWLLRRNLWRPWLGFASSALDVSLVTTALASFAIVSGPLVALRSTVTFEIYFLAIAALALRYDVRICVAVGALAVIEYATLWGVLAWLFDLGDPAYAVGVGEHSVVDQVTRLILLSAAVLLSYAYVRRARGLLHLASRDRLTGVYNRAQFDTAAAHEVERALRYNYPLSIAVLDLDHFKRVNDTLGHAAGDRVLVGIAERLVTGMRSTDLIARYGGEEFAVLFRDTDRNAAAVRVEFLRARVAAVPLRVTEREEITVTCSAGIAELRSDGVAPIELMTRADTRLLAAKRAGRNRTQASELERA